MFPIFLHFSLVGEQEKKKKGKEALIDWTYTEKKKKTTHLLRSSHHGWAVTNPTSIHENLGSIPSLTQWVKDPTLL